MIIFGSVRFLSKKVIKPVFYFKKTKNRFKPTDFGSFILEQKPAFLVWLDFSIWLGFFPVWLDFFSSVRFFQFQAYKIEPVGFLKILISLIGFSHGLVFSIIFFSGFFGLIGFLVFFLTSIRAFFIKRL